MTAPADAEAVADWQGGAVTERNALTETAVVVPVLAAEPVVAAHRLRLDPAAALGVPAHVTVLAPFVPPDLLSDSVIGRLASAIRTVPAFSCSFRSAEWFGESVLWLAPEPSKPFHDLIGAVCGAFPGYLPYGGEFDLDQVVPHLTVGERRQATLAELQAAQADLRSQPAVEAHVDHVLLMAGGDAAGSWRTLRELPLR
jgi:2'-5' RNA ligase